MLLLQKTRILPQETLSSRRIVSTYISYMREGGGVYICERGGVGVLHILNFEAHKKKYSKTLAVLRVCSSCVYV